MVLNVYCDKCNKGIKIRVSPHIDMFSKIYKIRRSWVAVSDALAARGWAFSEEGGILCPAHACKAVVVRRDVRGRKIDEDEHLDAAARLSFNVELEARLLNRFKLAIFFSNRDIKSTIEFLIKKYSDFVLSGNLREKSERPYAQFLEDREAAQETAACNTMTAGYADAAR